VLDTKVKVLPSALREALEVSPFASTLLISNTPAFKSPVAITEAPLTALLNLTTTSLPLIALTSVST
jgi:hypothetical protein